MQIDALVSFVGAGASPVSLVGSAGTAIQIGNVIDLLGNGAGNPPTSIIGNASVWGEAGIGIGRVKPGIDIQIGTAATTATSATATFSLQYAADNGSNQPATWYTANETNAHAASVLTAGQTLRMEFTPSPPEVTNPRFVRLLMTPPSGTDFTAGTVSFAGVTMVRDDWVNRFAANNYAVA